MLSVCPEVEAGRGKMSPWHLVTLGVAYSVPYEETLWLGRVDRGREMVGSSRGKEPVRAWRSSAVGEQVNAGPFLVREGEEGQVGSP